MVIESPQSAAMTNRNLSDMSELIVDAEGSDGQYWHDIVEFRELFYFLAWRDIIIRCLC